MATHGRASRVKMRSRPLDVNKALFIADTSQREPDDAEIEQALVSCSSSATITSAPLFFPLAVALLDALACRSRRTEIIFQQTDHGF
jgi:hypothetical protein